MSDCSNELIVEKHMKICSYIKQEEPQRNGSAVQFHPTKTSVFSRDFVFKDGQNYVIYVIKCI